MPESRQVSNIYQQLRLDEGCRLKVYTDSLGHPTIGVGRCLDTKGISELEANAMLEADIQEAIEGLEENGYSAHGDDDPRYYVLVNMAFNLGLHGLLQFRIMLKAYRESDWETAAAEMLRSKWATQVGDRAERLSLQMRTGEWV